MLSTKAGGTGINLQAANKVIIFDLSFNPQDDVQAENRAHRVGQTKEVEVIRLVSKGTVEEQIYALGDSKLKLDEMVAGEGDVGEKKGASMVQAMLEQEIVKKENGDAKDEGVKQERDVATKQSDVKNEYLDGLKAAGLDLSAA